MLEKKILTAYTVETKHNSQKHSRQVHSSQSRLRSRFEVLSSHSASVVVALSGAAEELCVPARAHALLKVKLKPRPSTAPRKSERYRSRSNSAHNASHTPKFNKVKDKRTVTHRMGNMGIFKRDCVVRYRTPQSEHM